MEKKCFSYGAPIKNTPLRIFVSYKHSKGDQAGVSLSLYIYACACKCLRLYMRMYTCGFYIYIYLDIVFKNEDVYVGYTASQVHIEKKF